MRMLRAAAGWLVASLAVIAVGAQAQAGGGAGPALPAGARLRLGGNGIGWPIGITVGGGPVRARGHPVLAAALSPDGHYLIANGPLNRGLVTFDRRTNKPVGGVIGGWLSAPEAVVLAPAGDRLAVSSAGGVLLAAFPSGAERHRIAWPGAMLDRHSAFSADGQLLALGSELQAGGPKTVKAGVVDFASGRIVCSVDVLQERRCAAGLSGDGKLLATWGQYWASDDTRPEPRRLVQLWDPATGKELRRLQVRAAECVVSAAGFSADGKTLCVASTLPAFHFFDVATGRETKRLASKHNDVRTIAFSPHGDWFVACSADDAIAAWRTADWQPVELAWVRGHTLSLAFPARNSLVAAGVVGQTLGAWTVLGDQSAELERGHHASVVSLAFTRDGKTLRSAGIDRAVCTWDAGTGKLLSKAVLIEPDLARERVANVGFGGNSIVLSPDATYAATSHVYNFHSVSLWTLASGAAHHFEHEALPAHFNLAFSSDSQQLAITGAGLASLWSTHTRQPLGELSYSPEVPDRSDAGVAAVALARDGRRLALVGPSPARSGSTRLRLLDAAAGRELFTQPDCPAGVRASMPGAPLANVAFAPDGKLIAFPDMDGSIILLRADTGAEYRRLKRDGVATDVTALAFAPDRRVLAVARAASRLAGDEPPALGESRLELWDLCSGVRLRPYTGHVGPITCLAFAPDGRTLASGGVDTALLLWDTDVARSPLPAALTGDDLAAAWNSLADASGKVSLDAEDRLSAAPKQSLPFLRAKLQGETGPTAHAVRGWLANLDSNDFFERETAHAKLEQLGGIVAPELRAARASAMSLEMRIRLDRLLAKLDLRRHSPHELRLARAIAVVEQIGTLEARELIQELASGTRSVVLLREAKAAWRRLSK